MFNKISILITGGTGSFGKALSTGKAANHINLYGATKHASDKPFVAVNTITGGHKARFAAVRNGNVVGSCGSVVPFSKKLIDEGSGSLPITDARMTRFWITLQQGVGFVLKGFSRMHDGAIFVPKTPSIKISDVAKAMAPDPPQKFIGIRPGEKLHEIMCPADDSYLTLEFADHFAIKPTIQFSGYVDFSVNKLGEKRTPVERGFEYNSGKNPRFLSTKEIVEVNHLDGI